MAEKKYYWLKLQKDFFKRHDIRIVENMPNGKDYILFYLKLLVESVSHYGHLRFSDTIPYTPEMLATITNTNIDVVKSAIELFGGLHMIEILDDATIFMSEIDKMIGLETEWAVKKRLYRQGQTPIKTIEGQKKTMSDKSKNKSKSKSIDKENNTGSKLSNYTANLALIDSITAFIEMRKSIKKPMTDKAMDMMLKKLDSLANDDAGKIEVLNQSTMNCWQGIFPVKDQKNKNADTDYPGILL